MNRPTGRSAAIAAAWLTAGAVGATALTGFAFAAGTNDSSAPAAYPAATQPPTTPVPAPNGQGGPGMKGRMGGLGGIGLGGPEGPVLHGDVVVKGKDGVIKTIRVQTGQVSAASATSITVKSTDGYESTWALNATTKIRRDMADATADKLAVGDTVMVRGEVSGGNATATVVRAFTAEGLAKAKTMRESMKEKRQDRRQGMRPNGPKQPAPTATEEAALSGFDI